MHRRVLPRPAGSIVYELTDRGRGLEDVVLALGRWGARDLGDPRPDEVASAAPLVMALRTTFRPAAAAGVRLDVELRLGDIVVHARVADGELAAEVGPLPAAELVITTGPALRALLAGELEPAAAVARGDVQISGAPALLVRFTELFRI